MKLRKLRLLAVFGLLALPLLGFLLPKRTQASSPVQVSVVNKPTVTVGNTPNVNVTNTPSVSVSNTPNVNVSNTPNVNVANQVGISAMPPVQVAGGNVAATVVAPVNVFTYAELYPIQVNGTCNFAAGSTECGPVDFYTVPDGFNAVITDFTGTCTNNSVIYGTAQLFAIWGGNTQTLTAILINPPGGLTFVPVPSGWGVTGARFYVAVGTDITMLANATSADQGNDNCGWTTSGYLVPTSVSSLNLGVKGAPNSGVRVAPRRK